MERHKCKLCSRTFANGRALGGHMKAHLSTLPLPPSKPQLLPKNTTEFSSFSYSETEEETEEEEQRRETEEEKSLAAYVLRENPKKSFKLSDPDQFSCSVIIVQDRESETESKNPPTRQQRSKRTRKISLGQSQCFDEQPITKKKPKPLSSFIDSPEQPLSSVSDTSPEEDVAMCLMMLSRDKWKNKNVTEQPQQQQDQDHEQEQEQDGGCGGIKLKKKVRGKQQCENCGKTFRSSRALGSHRSICCRDGAIGAGNEKIFECPFCFKVFGSGQALGGHKRSHLMASSSSTATNVVKSFIDLNLPAPAEEEEDDDEFSVVSDVSVV